QGAQDVAVIAVGEDFAFSLEDLVDGPGDTDVEPLDAAPEAFSIFRLDNEVDVIGLDRKFHHPHTEPIMAVKKPPLDLCKNLVGSKIADFFPELERHVNGKAARKFRPFHSWDHADGLGAASPFALAAPGADRELELNRLLQATFHIF